MKSPTSLPRPNWRKGPLARAGALLAGALLISAIGGWSRRSQTEVAPPSRSIPRRRRTSFLQSPRTPSFDGTAALLTLKLDRAEAILGYSARYQIPADLATAIYDIALQEGIDPQLAFRLVKVESNFKPAAKSNMNAIGFTQVQLATAQVLRRLAGREGAVRAGREPAHRVPVPERPAEAVPARLRAGAAGLQPRPRPGEPDRGRGWRSVKRV